MLRAEGGRDEPQDPCIELWRAVVMLAVEDAACAGESHEAQRIREAARRWLTGGGGDFTLVCHLALLDPDAVRESALKMRERGWPRPARVLEEVDGAGH
jgi:hypothetical protein